MDKYNNYGIYELRVIARKLGVKDATIFRRKDLIKKIEDVECGKVEPYIRKTKQGRPAKDINITKTEEIYNITKIDIESLNVLKKEFKKFYITLKNFNTKINFLIDEFLDEIGDWNKTLKIKNKKIKKRC